MKTPSSILRRKGVTSQRQSSRISFGKRLIKEFDKSLSSADVHSGDSIIQNMSPMTSPLIAALRSDKSFAEIELEPSVPVPTIEEPPSPPEANTERHKKEVLAHKILKVFDTPLRKSIVETAKAMHQRLRSVKQSASHSLSTPMKAELKEKAL
jgi:hypothetical protein